MSASEQPDAPEPRLRSDARANRERLLAAAVTALLREGRSVPLATIAREAGVGVGTLYRHYPDREALMLALQVRSLGLVIDLIEEIQGRGVPGIDGIREFLLRTVEHRAELVLPYHGAEPSPDPSYAARERRLWQLMSELVAAGVADGSLRPDLTAADVIVFGALLATPLPGVDDWPAVAARQVDLYVVAVSASGPSISVR